MQRRGALATIATAGLVAGTLDGLAAVIQYFIATGRNPARVFIYIASGVFGDAAYAGDLFMPVWGVAFHYLIATAWATAFYVAYPRLGPLARRPGVAAVLYGALIWCVMNLAVLPLSNVRRGPIQLDKAALAAGILVVCVALPIALLVGASRDAPSSPPPRPRPAGGGP